MQITPPPNQRAYNGPVITWHSQHYGMPYLIVVSQLYGTTEALCCAVEGLLSVHSPGRQGRGEVAARNTTVGSTPIKRIYVMALRL
ncbi:hypothetical protein MBAV_003927 [Candidatus Magnetobacterium bavaricum]|uniref:Uncharacterized protein n=1 Tax=Candidatus Magnetobacterium bavaricum TaxID=29290 RepID=A0A0F3GT92_9BACT|nr:hypothetical protein MBAV_003927 [Candidatus Magnetobacterium bavaricum]